MINRNIGVHHAREPRKKIDSMPKIFSRELTAPRWGESRMVKIEATTTQLIK
jgi:hypothetical protein